MNQFYENNFSQPENEPDLEVIVKGERYQFQELGSGKYFLFSAETEDHMGMPYKAWAALELAKKLGKEIQFDHNGATAKVDFSHGEARYTSESASLRKFLDEAFGGVKKDEVKKYVQKWMQKREVQDTFYQVIKELEDVEAAGRYNNLFESADVASALVEAVNNFGDIHEVNDPLARAATLLLELTTDLQEPWGKEGAGFDDYDQALTFVTHEAYRLFESRHQSN